MPASAELLILLIRLASEVFKSVPKSIELLVRSNVNVSLPFMPTRKCSLPKRGNGNQHPELGK